MKQPPEVKVIWGHALREMNWIIEEPGRSREVIATARPTGFRVQDYGEIPTINTLAVEVLDTWLDIRAGQDPSHRATHRLAPPQMRDLEPLPKEQK